jgi:outer membrane protein assembly factor BamD (BamD/ComL family)
MMSRLPSNVFFSHLRALTKAALVFAFLAACLPLSLIAQTDADIEALVAAYGQGKTEEVAAAMEKLNTSNPEHPGVLYLHGLTMTDADAALPVFKKIVDHYPKSAWADDALHKLEQYSYAIGAYRTAESYHAKLLEKYPSSPFAREATSDSRNENAGAAVRYAVEIGPFHKEKLALQTMKLLKDDGYSVELRKSAKGRKKDFSIELGNFASKKAALHMAEKIRKQRQLAAGVIPKP